MAVTALALDEPLAPHVREARSLMRIGAFVLALGLAPLATWVALAPLASAVVAPGVVKVDLNRRPVQHAEGGIVREVHVRIGQRVAEGQTLLVLGDVAVNADMQRWDSRVRSERASLARLEAEQSGAAAIVFPPDVHDAARGDAGLAELLVNERALFAARRGALTSQVALLRAQQVKVNQETQALRAQIERAGESLKLQGQELSANQGLLKEGFISNARVTQMEAQVADYGVKLEERRSELARSEQRFVDTSLRIKGMENEYRQQASDQLKVTQARLAEIQQEQRKTGDAAKRQVITAPASGEVMDLKVTAPGAVIPPRETIAEIVPDNRQLIIEALVRPEDINRVQRGQGAQLRFTAFAYRTTKLVDGRVSYISADRMVDKQSNSAFYVAHIEAEAAKLQEAGDLKLLAGMPVEVYIEGEQRTVLQYLMEPLTQVMRRAGRER
jgi:membrane fusion protein, epimerase transport system